MLWRSVRLVAKGQMFGVLSERGASSERNFREKFFPEDSISVLRRHTILLYMCGETGPLPTWVRISPPSSSPRINAVPVSLPLLTPEEPHPTPTATSQSRSWIFAPGVLTTSRRPPLRHCSRTTSLCCELLRHPTLPRCAVQKAPR